MTTRTRLTLALLAVTVAAGCGIVPTDDDRGLGDAGARQVDDSDVAVFAGPDTFMNVGAYCIGEDAVYIHTREAAPVVVADSKNCDEGGALAQVDRADAPLVLDELDTVDEGNG